MNQKGVCLAIFIVFCFFFHGVNVFGLTPAEEKQLFQILGEIKGELKQINKRIDDVNKRIDDVNKRIDDMNKRINEVKAELSQRIDDTNKRIDDTNKRIDDTNRRIDKLIDLLVGIVAVFGGLVVAMIGLVFWDRKTLIDKAKEKTIEEIETSSRLLGVLKELAKTDEKLAQVMRTFGLL